MEKERTWTVTLADGTAIENLTLNNGANTFHSPAEITEDTFDGKLSEVHIAASDGDMTGCAYPDTLHDAELVIPRTASGLLSCGKSRQMIFSRRRFRHSLTISP
jgi:hypothetical protein